MAIKKRTVKAELADKVAKELADKPYGSVQEEISRTSVSLPASMQVALEDLAIDASHGAPSAG